MLTKLDLLNKSEKKNKIFIIFYTVYIYLKKVCFIKYWENFINKYTGCLSWVRKIITGTIYIIANKQNLIH